jgi:hypothetical protein
MSDTTDMNALIRRAAFGMTEEEMNEAMAERKKPQPTDSNWLQRLYLASKGVTVKNDDEEGAN